MATMKVSLPESMKAWVKRQAQDGFNGNASDYVRKLIHNDQERTDAIAALQTAITEGVESGEPRPLDVAAFKLSAREKHVVR